jgi:hypothetical protein
MPVVSRLMLAGALLCALAAVLSPKAASAAPGGSLSMNPSNNSLNVNDTLAITFDVSGGIDIHRVAVAVTYNASVVQAVDADAGAAGTQILPGLFPGTDVEGVATQNTVSAGIINYQYELDGTAVVSGNGTIATVQFLAVANGNANLAFSVRTFTDGNSVTYTPSASAAVVVVGVAATNTPAPTNTPGAATSTSTNTPGPTSTNPPGPTTTGTTTPTRTPTRTPTSTGTPAATTTPQPTATPRITLLQDSNEAPPAAGVESGITNGTNPAQAAAANGLPSAGTEGPVVQWWRWTFFAAALMLGFAGWFFTFAVHYGDRDVVLMDRFDVTRRRHSSRRLPRR